MSTTVMVVAGAGDELPAAIRREHEAASSAARSALGHALECGRLLAQARQGIGHGSWETFVRDTCGIAPRTARLYLRLDANRERIANRQHVAGLTVREAARLVAEPRARAESAVVEPEQVTVVRDDERRLAVPDWYRPGYWHTGRHPSGWVFNVWPHPSGEPWVHAVTLDPINNRSPEDGNMIAAGPKRGIRIDAVLRIIAMQEVNGMPTLSDSAWEINSRPCDPGVIVKSPTWNMFLFLDQDDYLRRGLGIEPRRKAEVPA
jgi:hypothetical protein